EGQANLKVEIKINNKDISKIKKGQKLKYKFLTYDYSDYGVLDGKVYKISQDAFLTKKQAFYRAYGSLNNTVIKNKKNQIVGKIKPGMICEVSFIQKRQKILFVVLEKLKFWEEGPKTR
ncbi:MAG: HlyD family efflux transporter periplasmic adaptor subunit, partial [Candidatus Mcinerneyibacterium aminivorans]